jgi:hypothetical protein
MNKFILTLCPNLFISFHNFLSFFFPSNQTNYIIVEFELPKNRGSKTKINMWFDSS